MSEMFSQGEIDRIIEDSWHEWQEEEPCDVYDEYGNYKYPGDVELTEPNTATSMPCNDTISRQAALDAINRLSIHHFAYEVKTGWIVRDDAVDELMALQPVNPQPKTGHWILRDDINGQYQCDECGMFSGLSKFDVEEEGRKLSNFCSNCGTKMFKPQESEKI